MTIKLKSPNLDTLVVPAAGVTLEIHSKLDAAIEKTRPNFEPSGRPVWERRSGSHSVISETAQQIIEVGIRA